MEKLSFNSLFDWLPRIGWQRLNLLAGFFALLLLVVSFYWQFVLGADPCALCILQRIALIGLVLFCFLGAFLGTGKLRLIAVIQIFFSATGLWGAARQWWLQHYPLLDEGICMPHFSHIMSRLSVTDTLQILFVGTSDCSSVSHALFGLNPVLWLVGIFFSYTIFGLCLFRGTKKS